MYEVYDPKKDYFDSLDKSEKMEINGKEFVFLKGLERLAKERGIREATSKVVCPPHRESPIAVVTARYVFVDESIYSASADATPTNCMEGFDKFLTAMAESRAKARALRTAFGIGACSVEELHSADQAIVNTNKGTESIAAHQKILIENLCERHKISVSSAVRKFYAKSVDDLNKDEALRIIKYLNRESVIV